MNDHHKAEIGLLALIALAVSALAGWAIARGSAGESAAWSAILMAIVNSVKERWQARTIDRMSDRQSQGPSGSPGDPVSVVGQPKHPVPGVYGEEQ